MKSYTDLEQSKKLAETLPIESADMCFYYKDDIPQLVPFAKHNNRFYIPCWSLAALLDVLPSGKVLIHDKDTSKYKCIYKNIDTNFYDNAVDACVEMILKLKEENLL